MHLLFQVRRRMSPEAAAGDDSIGPGRQCPTLCSLASNTSAGDKIMMSPVGATHVGGAMGPCPGPAQQKHPADLCAPFTPHCVPASNLRILSRCAGALQCSCRGRRFKSDHADLRGNSVQGEVEEAKMASSFFADLSRLPILSAQMDVKLAGNSQHLRHRPSVPFPESSFCASRRRARSAEGSIYVYAVIACAER
jgi:hypothetical protein